MTQSEQAFQDLRDAIKAELVETVRQWWSQTSQDYITADDVEGAATDLLITLEQA